MVDRLGKQEDREGLATALNSDSRVSLLISFHGSLDYFLGRTQRQQPIRRAVDRKSSVKDVIESCGVPHPEVDLILADGQSVSFGFQILTSSRLDVFPFSARPDPSSGLQEREIYSFVADGHLGKLTRDLRLLGIDVLYENDARDQDLLASVRLTGRALLTRDRRLLMHRIVKHGYFPRSQEPFEQTVETILRFELAPRLAPFTRCLRCNGSLHPATKESVLDKLQPLTKLYYNEFTRCAACGGTYWHGSHMSELEKRVQNILACISPNAATPR